jgi:hypothetical protein
VFVARAVVEKKIELESATEENLISCLEVRTAGDPDEEDIVFTNLTSRELSGSLGRMGTPVGCDAIDTWLNDAGIRFRQIRKDVAGGEHADRNAQFACDSFKWFWSRIGKQRYLAATSILLVCGGVSNSANKYIFRHDLQQLCNEIGMDIRVAHYAPYCSKYNPIERRLFPHVGRACRGMLFDSIDRVVELIRQTSTATGLRTTVKVIRRAYEKGRNATEQMKQNLCTIHDELMPKWNYKTAPQFGH